jgi:hypothetical protein
MSETAPQSGPGYLVRHWRGELPLGEAFWRNGLGLGLLLSLAEIFVILPFIGSGNFRLFQAQLVSVLLVNGVFAVWVSVGIWRSANRHWISRAEAILAKVVVVVSLAVFVMHATFLVGAMTGFLLRHG